MCVSCASPELCTCPLTSIRPRRACDGSRLALTAGLGEWLVLNMLPVRLSFGIACAHAHGRWGPSDFAQSWVGRLRSAVCARVWPILASDHSITLPGISSVRWSVCLAWPYCSLYACDAVIDKKCFWSQRKSFLGKTTCGRKREINKLASRVARESVLNVSRGVKQFPFLSAGGRMNDPVCICSV